MRQIEQPYLLLIGDVENPVNAKTACGLRDWAPEACIGQLRFNDRAVDIGLPEMSLRESVAAGAKTLIIGIAPPGGKLPSQWHAVLLDALDAGLDIASGLHQRLRDMAEIADRAVLRKRQLHDVRHSDLAFPVGTGRRRPGRRLLTVGTDCALGKKYTALAITRELAGRGRRVDFRATGQTGILISGRGIALDAVTADFVAGAAEALSPSNAADHWDVIEGQGSLFHPAYAGVTLGLLHGSQPDALVLCHDTTRRLLNGFPHVPVVSPEEAIPLYLATARLTNPGVRFVGVSLNTSTLTENEAEKTLNEMSQRLNLPAIDPLRTGAASIAAKLEEFDAD